METTTETATETPTGSKTTTLVETAMLTEREAPATLVTTHAVPEIIITAATPTRRAAARAAAASFTAFASSISGEAVPTCPTHSSKTSTRCPPSSPHGHSTVPNGSSSGGPATFNHRGRFADVFHPSRKNPPAGTLGDISLVTGTPVQSASKDLPAVVGGSDRNHNRFRAGIRRLLRGLFK